MKLGSIMLSGFFYVWTGIEKAQKQVINHLLWASFDVILPEFNLLNIALQLQQNILKELSN